MFNMGHTNIYQEPHNIDSKLSSLGVTRKELIEVAIKAITAKNDAIAIDPINAPGQLAYIYGTRALREMLLPKGSWKIDRTDNIEATLNAAANIRIIYQNVDIACSTQMPKAISGKGNAAKRLVEYNTGYLWPEMEEEFTGQLNTSIWFFCVSTNGDEVRAELSRPSSIEGNQFDDFLERIFILTDNDWNPLSDDSVDDTDVINLDFDIPVTRK